MKNETTATGQTGASQDQALRPTLQQQIKAVETAIACAKESGTDQGKPIDPLVADHIGCLEAARETLTATARGEGARP
jgi:hypothetical protein